MREHIAHENGSTASTLPKMPFRKSLGFQHRPQGGKDRKTAFAETFCGIVSHAPQRGLELMRNVAFLYGMIESHFMC